MNSKKSKTSKTQSLLIVFLIYVLSIAVGYLSIYFFRHFHPVLQLALADLIATIVVFIFSYAFKNSSIYDPYWSVIPFFIVLWWIIWAPESANEIRQIIIFVLVLIWGARLTFNFIRGWKGLDAQDWRYSILEAKHGKYYWVISFLGIHLFPTVLVFMGCLPLYYVLQSADPIRKMDIIAAAITIFAIMVETMADEQLFQFKKKGNTGLMDRGLWKFSRHPNYFGEITFWIGVFIFCFATNINESWWTSVGCICMILLFSLVSIPMMEQRHMEKRPEYKKYRRQVPPLIPWLKM